MKTTGNAGSESIATVGGPRSSEKVSSPQDIQRLTKLARQLDSGPPKFKRRKGLKWEPEGDELWFLAGLAEAFGTGDSGLSSHLLGQVASTVPYGKYRGKDNLNYLVAALHGIAPRDELEGLLAVQMVAVHNLATEFMKRAVCKEQSNQGIEENVNRATRMLRTFVAQVEALSRYRGKGEQKMTVEHVHVHSGAQAIVGQVEVQKTRRGRNEEPK
jgi:hypothetical protein